MRGERNLVEVPVPGMVVMRERQLVQARILEELLERRPLGPAPFHVRDEPVLEKDLPAREEPAGAPRAREDTFEPGDRIARQPLLLERAAIHDRAAEAAGRLAREHVQMPAPGRASSPA